MTTRRRARTQPSSQARTQLRQAVQNSPRAQAAIAQFRQAAPQLKSAAKSGDWGGVATQLRELRSQTQSTSRRSGGRQAFKDRLKSGWQGRLERFKQVASKRKSSSRKTK